MIVIVCLDVDRGMLFHNRRQSRDRTVIWDILKTCGDEKIWMNAYSARLFENVEKHISCCEDFLEQAAAGEYCFVENHKLLPYQEQIEKLVVYQWNRKYPQDFGFDLELDQWILKGITEIKGYAHEMITKEIYIKGTGHAKV